MSYEQPRASTFYETDSRVICGWYKSEEQARESTRHADATTAAYQAASREAAEREAAYIRALNQPTRLTELPALKSPVLPRDFSARLAALDQRIYERGVAVSRERVLSLGQERFQDLLRRDESARLLQRIIGTKTDFTSWASVEYAFALANRLVTPVPKRRTIEQWSGAGEDRDRAATVAGFADLWKAYQEGETVRNVYACHDAFVSLVFGQSMLERLATDGRVRSHFFCGGKGPKVDLLTSWLSVLEGPHFRVVIGQPLWQVLAWLTKEQTPLVDPADLAYEWFGVRAPSRAQLKLCDAVMEGFLLDYRSWDLWDYVGRATRHLIVHDQLEGWRKELAKRLPAISQFHDVIRSLFYKPVSSYDHGHLQFDGPAHRRYLDQGMKRLLAHVSMLTALAIDETHPGMTVARFAGDSSLLCEGSPKAGLTQTIAEKLKEAFADSTFHVEVTR
jgi:hypothetical protein